MTSKQIRDVLALQIGFPVAAATASKRDSVPPIAGDFQHGPGHAPPPLVNGIAPHPPGPAMPGTQPHGMGAFPGGGVQSGGAFPGPPMPMPPGTMHQTSQPQANWPPPHMASQAPIPVHGGGPAGIQQATGPAPYNKFLQVPAY